MDRYEPHRSTATEAARACPRRSRARGAGRAPASTASPRSSPRCRPGSTSTPSGRWRRRAPPIAAPGGQGRRAAARRAGRHQGHHRHRRHADRERLPLHRAAARARTPPASRRCARAGAVIMGKTVTTELATFTPGKTRNPHNPAHTPGGSSSGSAAAVGGRHGAARDRHADQRLGHPAGGLLRRLRAQADLRAHPAHRRADPVAARSTRSACTAARWRTWRSSPSSGRIRRARRGQPGHSNT